MKIPGINWRNYMETKRKASERARQRYLERLAKAGKKPKPAKMPLEESRRRSRILQALLFNRLKNEMLDALSRKCTCCGEDRYEFLTMEHLPAHRDDPGHIRGVRGTAEYLRMHAMGWPEQYITVLCMQCNFASRGGRRCPHQSNPLIIEVAGSTRCL